MDDIMKAHVWKHVPGYVTAGGDSVYACPVCGGTEHVHGVEHPDGKDKCEVCGTKLSYYSEKTSMGQTITVKIKRRKRETDGK